MPGSPESLEGRNSVKTCWNGALDRIRARTRGIWPFEPTKALGTVATAKAPRGSGGLPKQKCILEVP